MLSKIIVMLVLVSMILLLVGIRYASRNIYNTSNLINNFFIRYCNDPVVFNPTDYEWTSDFRENWKTILGEYLNYTTKYTVPTHTKINKYTGSCDVKNKWRTLFLRAYNTDTSLSKSFPKTMELINRCPCTLAFFSVLEPGAKLSPHVGIYKGVIRYHLGLVIPDDCTQCFINVDNNIMHWKEGHDIMFDDTYLHHAENNTNQQRIILFLDIKRDFHNVFLNWVNSLFLKFIKSNDALNDTITNINLNSYINFNNN